MTHTAFKFISILVLCLLFRLLPLRPPNVEPILAAQMPFAKHAGALAGLLFGVLSILIYDLFTGTAGPWTLFTASAYGALGWGAARYLESHTETRHFAYVAVVGTLFYDATTGLTVGPFFFGQSFAAALLGQIPFTLMHLLGNVGFALTLSPMVERWITEKSQIANRKSQIIDIHNVIPAKAGNQAHSGLLLAQE